MATVTILTLIVCSLVTSCRATPSRKVFYRCVTLTVLRPPSVMVTGVDPEIRSVMVHRVRCPYARAMAHGAVMGELLCHMVRIRHLLEVCLMALITISIDQLVVAIHMAGLALHGSVRTRQREPCRAVIKCRRIPR